MHEQVNSLHCKNEKLLWSINLITSIYRLNWSGKKIYLEYLSSYSSKTEGYNDCVHQPRRWMSTFFVCPLCVCVFCLSSYIRLRHDTINSFSSWSDLGLAFCSNTNTKHEGFISANIHKVAPMTFQNIEWVKNMTSREQKYIYIHYTEKHQYTNMHILMWQKWLHL